MKKLKLRIDVEVPFSFFEEEGVTVEEFLQQADETMRDMRADAPEGVSVSLKFQIEEQP